MSRVTEIIKEEIMTSVANYPQFGDRLNSINEVGDASGKPYSFKFEDVSFNEVHYSFITEDQDDYIVYITNTDIQNGVWDMQFGVSGGGPEDVINKGRMYSVMSTILKITNDFIDKRKPNILKFEPAKKNDNERSDNMQRFKLYMAYLKKNMRPEYFGFEYYPYIVIERKVKIKTNMGEI